MGEVVFSEVVFGARVVSDSQLTRFFAKRDALVPIGGRVSWNIILVNKRTLTVRKTRRRFAFCEIVSRAVLNKIRRVAVSLCRDGCRRG